MRFAFLSDIHGNATALEAVITDLNKKDVDHIVVLGDLSFRGPEPKRCLNLIRSLDASVVKGNADEWLVRGFNEGEVPKEALDGLNKERDWTLKRLNDEDLTYLSELPSEMIVDRGQDQLIHAFHATPTSLFENVYPDETTKIEHQLMQKDEADVYAYGHIHLPFVRSFHGKNVINPGSVGLPFDGHPLASYIIADLEEGRHTMQIHRVPYNREHVVELYHQGGYPNIETMGRVVFYGVKP
ncbi:MULTISPECIES: metallophosphoesterase family protein [Alkalihalophilus]|jgi:putative phosphoesterase|uniref:Phosphoesterase n=3 Tax=Alkalihalophilus TaxID=2893060 RepID=D3G0P1_ALKPO|nr:MULTISPECIES: YfcE family phosphodiesterase [Alkalihalophilus]ADC51203.1 posphoesterase [Alkalihalophilus pseudofirmus OF4]ERN54245.1 phosphodiesterase [Alkalihalophilus marmarensis DSM 21297]MCM3488335.1 YfcE family phosphodiesterase [Alkalihalophilus marmarensis]MDV2884393.1 YfcE family phosphodiesterase [Alkalihalophilus pseudofirmus]MEC2070882.1 YfcE family phosphodiesterase [Alkalihalophilus marmarensis]